MPCIHITICLRDGTQRSGVRLIPDPVVLEGIRHQAWRLAGEVLGREHIEDVQVNELPASDPALVALIISNKAKSISIPRSDGEHPYTKQQQRRPPRQTLPSISAHSFWCLPSTLFDPDQ